MIVTGREVVVQQPIDGARDVHQRHTTSVGTLQDRDRGTGELGMTSRRA